MTDRIEKIRQRLTTALRPTSLEITDESHLHAGHEGAKSGRGHYQIRIVCEEFAELNAVARHRAVYSALGDLMKTDIHALGINAISPSEQ